MTEIVSTRVTDEMAKDLDEIEKEDQTDRATVVRKLLAQAISKRKLEKVLVLYREGKITLWKAAKITGLSLIEIVDVVKERKIPLQYGAQEFREDSLNKP